MKHVLLTGLAIMAVTATAFAQENITLLDQSGNYSQASAQQTGRLNVARLTQFGNGTSAAQLNRTQVTQVGDGASGQNTALVFQQGHGHEVQLRQTGVTNYASFTQQQANARAFANQNGQGNAITAVQRSADGTAVEVTINQNGQRNGVNINIQTDLFNARGTSAVFIAQTGNDHKSELIQLGDANATSISQVNSYGNAKVIQNGVLNNARVTQTSIGSTALSFNHVNLEQLGERNMTMTTQTGTNNMIRMRTMGNDNMANLNQTGTGHVVRGIGGDFAIQNGNFNSLTTTQNGSNHFVNSSQVGNFNSGVVTQNNF